MDVLSAWLAAIGQSWEWLIGPDAPSDHLLLRQIAVRAALIFLIGVAIIRWGKSRLISDFTTVDVLLGYILGSLLSRGIQGTASLSGSIVSGVVVVAAHRLITSFAMRSRWFETLIKGHSRVVIQDGVKQPENLKISHLSAADLEEQLRLQGIDDPQQVKLATKERNGEVSVIRKPPEPRVLEVSVQQGVQTVRIVVE